MLRCLVDLAVFSPLLIIQFEIAGFSQIDKPAWKGSCIVNDFWRSTDTIKFTDTRHQKSEGKPVKNMKANN